MCIIFQFSSWWSVRVCIWTSGPVVFLFYFKKRRLLNVVFGEAEDLLAFFFSLAFSYYSIRAK
jgi:hypothetical protein